MGSPVSLASRDQDGGPSDSTRHLRSNGKIGDCEQSKDKTSTLKAGVHRNKSEILTENC